MTCLSWKKSRHICYIAGVEGCCKKATINHRESPLFCQYWKYTNILWPSLIAVHLHLVILQTLLSTATVACFAMICNLNLTLIVHNFASCVSDIRKWHHASCRSVRRHVRYDQCPRQCVLQRSGPECGLFLWERLGRRNRPHTLLMTKWENHCFKQAAELAYFIL